MLRRIYRIALSVPLLVLGGVIIRLGVLVDRQVGRDPGQGLGRRCQAAWCRVFCRLFGVRMELDGPPVPAGPVLLVANHVSWLDILCVAAHWPVSFLSKSEIRRWPIVGAAATALGTLYIERGARNAADQAVTAMGGRLGEGYPVVFFPEGTTSDGSTVLPFRPRLFQAAVDAGAPVQPLALSYRHPDGSLCREAAFVGQEPLPRQVWRMAAVPRIQARIQVTPTVPPAESRTELARRSHEQVAVALGLEVPIPRRRAAGRGISATDEHG